MNDLSTIYAQMAAIAAEEGARRLVLFGSRARGTASPRSDIDLAVEGCGDFGKLYDRLQEEPDSLLKVDVIDLDTVASESLKQDIARDGKVLYEKMG